jgi:hypothetical protein
VLDGWRSFERVRPDGAVDSVQSVLIAAPVVEATADSASSLGERYWRQVRHASHGLVRWREHDGRVELRLLSAGPTLLRFTGGRVSTGPGEVGCSYAIDGGLLARRPGGAITFTQSDGDPSELSVAVEGYFPRLGRLLGPLQSRFHVHVSRRYFRAWLREARR